MGLHNPLFPQLLPAKRMRVIVADPFPVVQLGLRKMMEEDPRLHIVAEVSTMQSLWKNVLSEQPEVALLDWCTASQDLGVTRALLESDRHPTSIIFLTASEDLQQRRVMLRLGAVAVLSKTCTPEELRATILKACPQPLPDAAGLVRYAASNGSVSRIEDPSVRILQLTRRERQLIPLVSSGLKNKEIALELGISESTVWHHLTAVFTKLQVEDRLGLAAFAFSHGLARSGASAMPDVQRTPVLQESS